MTNDNTTEITFKELNLNSNIQKALLKHGYVTPTPIQAQSIPGLLEGRDLIGVAQTGTGKTASFTLPVLELMNECWPRKIQTLVLAPTRELAAQIGESFSKYGEYLPFKQTVIFGGVGQGNQVHALRKGVDVVVATPGRLLDLLNQRKLSLKDVAFFVLDEADRMLDMGFIHDIKKIIAKLPAERQSLFFSATMSPEVHALARNLLKDPIHVEITPAATTVEKIDQFVLFVDQEMKLTLLLDLLQEEKMSSVLIFTRTKHRANKVSKFLNNHRITSDAIHGNKSQTARTKALKGFRSGKVKVLVATDIAARGIDVDNISHVINFELPNESESYVHRIGRTARAGTDGIAYSFCAAEERNYLRNIERLITQKIPLKRHEYHSDTAQNATGAAAKPPPKGRRSLRDRRRGGGRGKPTNGRHKGESGRSMPWKKKGSSASGTRGAGPKRASGKPKPKGKKRSRSGSQNVPSKRGRSQYNS